MLERLREMGILSGEQAEEEEEEIEQPRFRALRILTAKLFLATGAHALAQYLGDREVRLPAEDEYFGEPGERPVLPNRPLQTTVWASAVLGPAAGVAHLVHALQPSEGSHIATRVLNGAVIGLGLAGFAGTLLASVRGTERFSVAPLLFGYVGALGYFLDREESQVAAEQEELERRARIVERWIPRRRPKLDRIVVHV